MVIKKQMTSSRRGTNFIAITPSKGLAMDPERIAVGFAAQRITERDPRPLRPPMGPRLIPLCTGSWALRDLLLAAHAINPCSALPNCQLVIDSVRPRGE